MTCRFCGSPLVATGDVCNDREELKIGKCEAWGLVQTMSVDHVEMEHYTPAAYLPDDLDQARKRERL